MKLTSRLILPRRDNNQDKRPDLGSHIVLPFAWCALLLAVLSPLPAQAASDFDQAVETARTWLSAKPADRAPLETFLQGYTEDIDAVIHALMPKGDPAYAKIVGREVKGDTFVVPELLARNEDHPFNYYVPTHYDPAKPMGLILWMHGGGTYKPGDNVDRKSIPNKMQETEMGDYILVAAEACHGVNFPEGAVLDKMAGRWSVPAAERYLGDLVNEFMHRYHIDPNRVVLWGYSMGGIGAYNQAMRTDRFAVVGIGGGAWTHGTFDTMINTPAFIWHGNKDSYWNSPKNCRNRLTDVSHSRIADQILTDLGFEHLYVETDGGHDTVNTMDGKPLDVTRKYFFNGREGYMVDKRRDPYARRVIAMTPRGSYETVDPLTSGDVFHQAESRHDRWVSIEKFTPGPVPVDFIIKEGKRQKASTLKEWQDYKATRSKGTFQGARIEIENLGDNRFAAKTTHVDSFSIWLHPEMADLSKPITVTTYGVTTAHTCKPSLLTSLQSFERRQDWGLIYPAMLKVTVSK